MKWSLENHRFYGRHLLVVCPKCGEIGRLYFSKKIGWYIKHGAKKTHSIRGNEPLTIPLHQPRLNLIHYMGGDSFLLPYLAKLIPPHSYYIEVFGGGAPLLLNKPPSKVEIYNDLDGELVNLFKTVRDHYDEFKEKTKWLLYSRQLYYEYLHALQNNKINDPVERAVAYWYVLNASFNGKFGLGFSASLKANHAKRMWGRYDRLMLLHKRLKNVTIEQLDFREVIKRYDSNKSFFYLDPPHLYAATEKDHTYYRRAFTDSDYMDLLAKLEKARGKWLLKQSHDIPWLIEWAQKNNYNITVFSTVKQSQLSRGKKEKYKIYLIANYPLSK